MIMADKIIELRKKNGWSQEELAYRLNVSRQAVSKWEGAQSIPDLDRVVAMANLFGVSTDYLLKDELGENETVYAEGSEVILDRNEEVIRRVSMTEANSYLSISEKASERISLGVMICILSPIPVILLSMAAETGHIPFNDDQGGIMGTIILMLMVAFAVFLFVQSGMELSKYSYLEEECIDTEYGVSGMVRERKQEYEHTHMTWLIIGIVLCVLSAIPILSCCLFAGKFNMAIGMGVGIALAMIAIGVWMIVRVSIIWGSYQKLLEEGEYCRKTKRSKNSLLSGIYWSLITAAYLGYSFWTGGWNRSWIIWPVAGVAYAAVRQIEEALMRRR